MTICSTKTQAEIFVEALILGLVNPSEVVEWIDGLITDSDSPDDWLLDLSMATDAEPKRLIELLHLVPGQPEPSEVRRGIVELRSRFSRPFGIYDTESYPPTFAYPEAFRKIAKEGRYLYNPAIEFIDANASYAQSLLGHVRAIDPSYIPFAKGDDRFYCFNVKKPGEVVIADIVEKTAVVVGDFATWWRNYQSEALCNC